MKVIAAAVAAYALFLPVALWIGTSYVQPPRPAGNAVEMMLKFEIDDPDRYVARSYLFGPKNYPDTSRIRIFEGSAPIPVADTQFIADGPAYVVRFRTCDGTDARANGRQYWIVAMD